MFGFNRKSVSKLVEDVAKLKNELRDITCKHVRDLEKMEKSIVAEIYTDNCKVINEAKMRGFFCKENVFESIHFNDKGDIVKTGRKFTPNIKVTEDIYINSGQLSIRCCSECGSYETLEKVFLHGAWAEIVKR